VVQDSEIQQAFFTPSTRKAPGPDRLTFAILRQVYTVSPLFFNCFFKALFQIGYHPKLWRTGVGIILPKLNKPDYSVPKAYRIITLLNGLGKILERIVAVRLGYLANTTDLLYPSQIGGRKQRSAIDIALLLLHFVESQQRISSKWVTSSLFLDIKGAFDHVSKATLIQTLTELRLP
jgi:hypothetical protein